MKKTVFVALLLATWINIYSQAPPPPEDEDPDAPLDGGIALFLAGGIGYGIRKAYKIRTTNKER